MISALIRKTGLMAIVMLMVVETGAQAATITYTADNGIIANPERGYWSFNSNNFGSQGLPLPLSDMLDWLNTQRQNLGMTTIVTTYGLSAWKTTTTLPTNVLDLINDDFSTARQHGYKVIPRFSYCTYIWPPPPGTDATPAIIAGHLAQLKPIFAKNTDVMALGGLGMFGFWGEQWGTENTTGSRYGEVNNNTRAIFAAMLDAVPISRMLMMRYMPAIRQLLGDTPCPESEAFTGTDRSRVGHYNDCFLAEGSSEFGMDEGPWSYTSIQGAYTPDLAVDMSCASVYTDQMVVDNLDKQHFDFPSLDNGNLGSATLQEIYKKAGYRYRLVSATIPDATKAGNGLSISIEMTNDGYSGIFNPRKIEVILRNQTDGTKYVLNVIGDDEIRCNRLYLPKSHETKTLAIAGGLPASMPAGNYEVILNLPDPYSSIHDDPRYSIHLANTGVWESTTGYNKLNHTLAVNATAGGITYTGSNWFSVNGITTPTEPTIQTPYGGTARAVPGTIQAEDYDVGGEGVAYHDLVAGNELGAYRTDSVDIEATTDVDGGYQIGHTGNGEWLEYSVNVATPGTYSFDARVASADAMQFHLYVDGTDVATVDAPATGSWTTWATVSKAGIALTAGQHVIRFAFTSNGFCLNWIRFSSATATLPKSLRSTAIAHEKAVYYSLNGKQLTGVRFVNKTLSRIVIQQVTIGGRKTMKTMIVQ